VPSLEKSASTTEPSLALFFVTAESNLATSSVVKAPNSGFDKPNNPLCCRTGHFSLLASNTESSSLWQKQ
jgi:hypothetical protein